MRFAKSSKVRLSLATSFSKVAIIWSCRLTVELRGRDRVRTGVWVGPGGY